MRNRYFFTDEQAWELVAENEAGSTHNALARKYGCSNVTIRNTFRRVGYVPTYYKHGPPQKVIEPAEAEAIIARHQAGESQAAIAADTGIALRRITRLLRERGIPTAVVGERSVQWKGGRAGVGGGYTGLRVSADDPFASMRLSTGYVPEHRLVMARHLGRPLLSTEHVHHINGVKTDNRLENLELWTTAHPRGLRVADQVEFARDILATYGLLF